MTYRFELDLFTDGGAPLGTVPAEVDWLPAIECAHFDAIRHETLPAVSGLPEHSIVPLWNDSLGAPHVAGARIDVAGASVEIDTEPFREGARRAALALVERGTLAAGEHFRYRVRAGREHERLPSGSAALRGARGAHDLQGAESDVEELRAPLALDIAPIAPLLTRAIEVGEGDPIDPPVFLPESILREAEALVADSPRLETGGILLGLLHRDPARRSTIFVEITALVPAHDAERHEMKLTFTPATWAAAEAALHLRRRGEILAGWVHSHPFWCRRCPEERRRECPLAGVFFSRDDVALHRTVFPRAFQVALLLTDREGGAIPSLFGWRGGRVASRAFHLLDGPTGAARPTVVATQIGGDERAPNDHAPGDQTDHVRSVRAEPAHRDR